VTEQRVTYTANVGIKSIYEKPDPTDGKRILVTQYWPRGVPEERADQYIRALGPSRGLLRAFKDGVIGWDEYRVRYLQEMKDDSALMEIHRLAKLSRSEKVTIMCVCKYGDQCHRRLLRELILRFDE